MHEALLHRLVTLGDMLGAPELELKLVSGPGSSHELPIRGAHLTEILDPGRWLDQDWVMITTGLQMQRDAARQRRLVRELSEQGITALGYCLGIVNKTVPSALLDEARKLDYPLFTVPLHVPVRVVITKVNRMLLATDEELFDRAVTLHDYLLAGLDASARTSLAPESHLVSNLSALLELRVDYLDPSTHPVGSTVAPDPTMRALLDSTSKQGTTKLRHEGADLLVVPCRLGARFSGWLVVHLPQSMETGRPVLSAAQAVARLIAVAVVSRQHSTENLDALGEELMTLLLDRTDGPKLSVHEDLESLGQSRALPVLHQLGFDQGLPIRALVAELASGDERELKALLRASRLPYLCTVHEDTFIAAVQASAHDLRTVVGRFGRPTGIGGAVPGISELHRSIRQARFALRAARRHEFFGADGEPACRFVDYDKLPLGPWMAEQVRETVGAPSADRYVQPLLEQPLLLEAVTAFLQHDQDVPAAARDLHLHPNSLRYRLDKVEGLLRAPLRRPSVLASLYLALTANELL